MSSAITRCADTQKYIILCLEKSADPNMGYNRSVYIYLCMYVYMYL